MLQTWFYEKFRVHELDPSISYVSRRKPLIQHWDDAKAAKVDKIINNNYLGVGEVNLLNILILFWQPYLLRYYSKTYPTSVCSGPAAACETYTKAYTGTSTGEWAGKMLTTSNNILFLQAMKFVCFWLFAPCRLRNWSGESSMKSKPFNHTHRKKRPNDLHGMSPRKKNWMKFWIDSLRKAVDWRILLQNSM